MPRITLSMVLGQDCPDKGMKWDLTPCLCDCHYRSGNVCGDMDKVASGVTRVTRRRRRPE